MEDVNKEFEKLWNDEFETTILYDFYDGDLTPDKLKNHLLAWFKKGFEISEKERESNPTTIYYIEQKVCDGCCGWSDYDIIPNTITKNKNKALKTLHEFNSSCNKWESFRLKEIEL